MTDLSKQLLEKANGGPKVKPDEQRLYLGTFEERVMGYADIETANSVQLQHHFTTVLETFRARVEPLFVKISPKIEFDKQVFYLKQAKEANCQATIVSEEHATSPFGLVIHADAPVQVTEKDIKLAFPNLWKVKEKETSKKSIWKKWFG